LPLVFAQLRPDGTRPARPPDRDHAVFTRSFDLPGPLLCERIRIRSGYLKP